MSAVFVITGEVWENGSATILARINGRSGSGTDVANEGRCFLPADVSSITCNVYFLDSTSPDTPVSSPAVVVGTSVLSALATDGSWDQDTIGYNFAHDLPVATFQNFGSYLVEYYVTLANAMAFPVVAKINCPDIKSK